MKKKNHDEAIASTVIVETSVCVKILYSNLLEVPTIHFRTTRTGHMHWYYDAWFSCAAEFVLSAKSTKSTKLTRIRKFLRLQCMILKFDPPALRNGKEQVRIAFSARAPLLIQPERGRYSELNTRTEIDKNEGKDHITVFSRVHQRCKFSYGCKNYSVDCTELLQSHT